MKTMDPIPDDPRIDRDPSEPIQPPARRSPRTPPEREQPIEEPDDSPAKASPERARIPACPAVVQARHEPR